MNILDYKNCQNKVVEFKVQRKSQSEHKQRVRNVQVFIIIHPSLMYSRSRK